MLLILMGTVLSHFSTLPVYLHEDGMDALVLRHWEKLG